MKKTKAIAIILIVNLICSLIFSLNPSNVFFFFLKIDNQISKIDDKKYPGIKKMIENLQNSHKSWKFKVLYTLLNFY